MNKKEFLQRLREKLTQMPEEEVNAALRYYEEYFDEAGIQNEDRVLQELGSPEQVAKQILADGGVREEKKGNGGTKGRMTVWITVGIVLCIIVLGSIFGKYNRREVIFSSEEPITNDKHTAKGQSKSGYIDVDEVVDSFENIDVEIDMMDVTVKQGKEYKVAIHCLAADEMTYEVKNKTLTCVQRNTKEFNSRKNTMTIYVPEGAKLDGIDISSGIGDSSITNITAASIISENGMGDFKATEVSLDKVDVELGMGDAIVIGQVKGDIEIENGMGDVKLNLMGTRQDYNYDIERGLGTVKIDNVKHDGLGDVKESNNASKNITVSNGMGDTIIEFK